MFPGKIYTDQLKRLLVLVYALPIVYNSCAVQIQSVNIYHEFNFLRMRSCLWKKNKQPVLFLSHMKLKVTIGSFSSQTTCSIPPEEVQLHPYDSSVVCMLM